MEKKIKNQEVKGITVGFGIPSSVYQQMIHTSHEIESVLDVDTSTVHKDAETGASYLFLKKRIDCPETEGEYSKAIEAISSHILRTIDQILNDEGLESSANTERKGEYWRIITDLLYNEYTKNEIQEFSTYPRQNRHQEHVAISKKANGKFVIRVKAPTFERLKTLWTLGWSNIAEPLSKH